MPKREMKKFGRTKSEGMGRPRVYEPGFTIRRVTTHHRAHTQNKRRAYIVVVTGVPTDPTKTTTRDVIVSDRRSEARAASKSRRINPKPSDNSAKPNERVWANSMTH